MAFYYVKSGGTATGDAGRYATKQTGSFAGLGASGYYNDLQAMLATVTTAPSGGDFVLLSDLHSYDHGSVLMTYSFSLSTTPIRLISVSDTAIDTYSAGAREETNQQIRFEGALVLEGLNFDTTQAIIPVTPNGFLCFRDCLIELTGAGQPYFGSLSGDGWTIETYDCEINAGNSSASLKARSAANIRMFGTRFTGVAMTNLVGDSVINGGVTVELYGCDLSNITGYLVGNHGNATTDDQLVMIVSKCELAPLVSYYQEAHAVIGNKLLVTNSSNDVTRAEYQYYLETGLGTVEDEATIYRDESTAFESGTKVSLKAVTLSNCVIGAGVAFDLSRYAELSTSGTVRVYFASTDTLTDQDVWAELIYPDGTNANQYNYLSTRNADPLAAGTTHTVDTGSTWKNGAGDLTGHNEYYLDIDTSVDPGSNGVPLVRIHVDKPSTTVYFDTTIGLV